MALKFHGASCVIAGTFNIYIIRPDWLGKAGFLKPGSEVKFESQLHQPGFRLQSSHLGSKWIVAPNQLVLETEDPGENCGVTADRILEILPWTPLLALGFNFNFRCQPSDIQNWSDKSCFPPVSVPSGFVRKARTWHIGVDRDAQRFNLQVIESEDSLDVRANVHTELENRNINFARETAREFFQHRASSLELIHSLFEIGIDNAINNDDE